MSGTCSGFRLDCDGTRHPCVKLDGHGYPCAYGGRTAREKLVDAEWECDLTPGTACAALGIDPDLDLDTHRLVAVSPEVARLIAAVGADNLPALLRHALWSGTEWTADEWDPHEVDYVTWGRLRKALDGDA